MKQVTIEQSKMLDALGYEGQCRPGSKDSELKEPAKYDSGELLSFPYVSEVCDWLEGKGIYIGCTPRTMSFKCVGWEATVRTKEDVMAGRSRSLFMLAAPEKDAALSACVDYAIRLLAERKPDSADSSDSSDGEWLAKRLKELGCPSNFSPEMEYGFNPYEVCAWLAMHNFYVWCEYDIDATDGRHHVGCLRARKQHRTLRSKKSSTYQGALVKAIAKAVKLMSK